MQHVGHIS